MMSTIPSQLHLDGLGNLDGESRDLEQPEQQHYEAPTDIEDTAGKGQHEWNAHADCARRDEQPVVGPMQEPEQNQPGPPVDGQTQYPRANSRTGN
jgi:hypothetical protein